MSEVDARSKVVALALILAYFGAYIAVMSPPTVSMALRVQDVVGSSGKVATLSTVLSIGALAGAIASPLLGKLSDRTTIRFGKRRTWLVLGPVTGFVGMGLIGFGSEVWVLVVGWILAQAGWSGAIMVEQSVLAEHIPSSIRGRVSGLIGPAQPVGMVAGTLIVSFTVHEAVLMMLLPGALGLAGALFLMSVVPDQPANKADVAPLTVREFLSFFWVNPRRYPNFAWAFLSRFLVFSAVFIVVTYQPYIISDRIGITGNETANAVFQATLLMGVGAVIASVLFGMLGDRTHHLKPWMRLAAAAAAAGLVFMAMDDTFAVFAAGMIFIGIAQGGYLADDLPLVTRVVPDPNNTAGALGVYNLGMTLPQMLIPIYGAVIIGTDQNYPPLFLLGVVFAVIALFTLAGVHPRPRSETEAPASS